VFQCVQDMMSKGPNIFLIHFIRLGVLQKISEMANQFEVADQDVLIDGKIMDKVMCIDFILYSVWLLLSSGCTLENTLGNTGILYYNIFPLPMTDIIYVKHLGTKIM